MDLMTYKLKCPECGDIMDLEADPAEVEAEDGALVECLSCKVDSEYSFADFKLSEDDFDDEEDDEPDDVEDLDDDEEDDEPAE